MAFSAPEVLNRSKLYIDAHHTLIRIEYNSTLSDKARRSAIRTIVPHLKALVEPDATHRAAGIRTPFQMRSSPHECYLCMALEEPICDSCYGKVALSRYMIVCKKIGNSLLDHLLRSKADKAAIDWEASKQDRLEEEKTQSRHAQLENMRTHLESIRRHNREKQQQIEHMRTQLALLGQENVGLVPILESAHVELESIRSRYDSRKTCLFEKQKMLSIARHSLLIDLHPLHCIEWHDVDSPHDIPGAPRLRLPRSNSRSLLGLGTSSSLGPPSTGSSSPSASPTPKAATIGAISNQQKPTWHFLHQVFLIEGSLTKTMPYPTTTLIPFLTMLYQVAKWWHCALPNPIEPLPVPKVYCSSLVNHHPSSGFTPLNDGWHIIPVVSSGGGSASNFSEYDSKIHQLIADNARTLIRAIGMFPEEAMDLGDNWLNTLFFSLNLQYVRSFHRPPTLGTSTLGQSGVNVAGLMNSFGLSTSTATASINSSALASSIALNSMTSSSVAHDAHGRQKRGRALSKYGSADFHESSSQISSSSSSIEKSNLSTKTPIPTGGSNTTNQDAEIRIPPANDSGWLPFLQ
jgi:hypothetical protein